MLNKEDSFFEKNLFENLKIKCGQCFGFCCVALYFSKSEGFPTNKEAGKPCKHLQTDFSCQVHQQLREKGLKGCTAYDCFGAGQKVAQTTYGGKDWKEDAKVAKEMFEVFLVVRQLHEMLWYLTQAFVVASEAPMGEEIRAIIEETEGLTDLRPTELLALDVEAHRNRVNVYLKAVSEKASTQSPKARGNFMGRDLRRMNLKGMDLRGEFLIAANLQGVDLSGANLIGADMRDTDVRGANLKNTLFLTQVQINSARGDKQTQLPGYLTRPAHWS